MSPLPRPPACAGCPAEHDVPGHFVPIDRDEGQALDIWGERGGRDEGLAGAGFVGKSGARLRWAAKAAGVPNFRARNAVLCTEISNAFPSDEVARGCLDRHQPEALGAQPARPTLLCGANVVRSLTGFDLPPLEVRGSVVPLLGGGWGVCTFHPALLLYVNDTDPTRKGDPSLEPLLILDIKRALRGGAPRVPIVHVARPQDVLAKVKPGALVAVDIEGGEPQPSVVGFAFSRDEAFVVPWSHDCVPLLRHVFDTCLPLLHNASYDVGELAAIGIEMPKRWIDTLVLAALQDPGLSKGLGKQVLTWVPGTTAWKKLVVHGDKKPTKTHAAYRAMWREILTRIDYPWIPETDEDHLRFYNGLDCAWCYGLAEELRKQIGTRWPYYQSLLNPLQRPLVEMGLRGIPYDPALMAHHQAACDRLVRMAQRILNKVASPILDGAVSSAQCLVDELVAEREAEASKKFTKAVELSKARGKLRAALATRAEGFNMDSPPQRAALLYEWYGLPPQTNKQKTRGGGHSITTDDLAIESLLRRLTRTDPMEEAAAPTVKPKRGTIEEVARVLRAMRAGRKWGVWSRNFLGDSHGEEETLSKVQEDEAVL